MRDILSEDYYGICRTRLDFLFDTLSYFDKLDLHIFGKYMIVLYLFENIQLSLLILRILCLNT